MSDDATYPYDERTRRLRRGAWNSTPHVIDSWLHADGATRALDEHFRRFRSATDRLADPHHLQGFFAAAAAALPATGQWFPRLECTRDGKLALRIRSAPTRQRTATLWTFPAPDPRTNPTTKGPDLDTLHTIRGLALRHGADEAVLTAPGGHVLEGATTALVWWDAGALCVPLLDEPVLFSVTRSLVEAAARHNGINVGPVNRHPDDVAGRPCWILNALHGIRPVTAWIGHSAPPQADPSITALFRDALDAPQHRSLPHRETVHVP